MEKVTLSPDERRRIKEAANRLGLGMSPFLRMAALQAADEVAR